MIKKCMLCRKNDATQKNSHITPSFLVSMVASYDGSYQRDKELMYTITPLQSKVYTGALPDTTLETTFNTVNLSEERIQTELKHNPETLDYIFCPDCEKKLSTYLETPYASNLKQNQSINAEIPILFWISVIWRKSIAGHYGFKLPLTLENRLRECLYKYFEINENIELRTSLLNGLNFRYKILHCENFSKAEYGCIHGEYYEESQLITILLGDICICGMFETDEIPDKYSFFGLEKYLKQAPWNEGKDSEKRLPIETELYRTTLQQLINHIARLMQRNLYEFFDKIWIELGFPGIMPTRMKRVFVQKLSDDSTKPGDKYTTQCYLDIFKELIKNIRSWYYIS